MMKRKTFEFVILTMLALAIAASAVEKRKIDFVVGVDGDFKAALAAASASGASASKQFVIFLPDGEYDLTNLTADRHGKTTVSASYLSIIGQSMEKTIIAMTMRQAAVAADAIRSRNPRARILAKKSAPIIVGPSMTARSLTLPMTVENRWSSSAGQV